MNEIESDSPGQLNRERGNLLVIGSALSLAVGAYFWRLYLLRVRFFDQDEFEHLHSAWCISKGLLPYRDFFEHHTPWLYFFLAQFFRFFDVDTKVADAQAFLFFARTWMWIFAGLILVLTLWLGRLWRHARVGCVAALFLGNTLMFLEKTIEVRPDVPSVVFWLACLVAAVRGIREEESARKSRWRFGWSGIFLGAALMCTQKMLLALPGFGLAMLWYLLDARSLGTRRQRFWNVACQLLGFCLPVLLTLTYFAVRGALGQFFEYNFFLNLHWKYRFPPGLYLKHLVNDNPILVGLAVAGFFRALWDMFGRERFRQGDFVYVLSALGLFGGLFIIQVPWRQYYLTFLPMGAVFAGTAFLDAMGWAAAAVRGDRARNARSVLYVVTGTSVFAALVILALKVSRPQSLNRLINAHEWFPRTLHAELWLVALVSAAVCFLFRRENFATAVLLAGLSLYPFKIMLVSGGTAHPLNGAQFTNTTTLNEIRYVLQNTSPTDTCMDGWTGLGVFRPHAWFYWFLHVEIRGMLSERTKNDLAANLRSGSITPKLIFYDEDLQGLSAETTQFFEKNYEPTGEGTIWRRKGESFTRATEIGTRIAEYSHFPFPLRFHASGNAE